jgi:hypothetical protein
MSEVRPSHLGQPMATVARQSDWALFTLGLNLAKSTSFATRRKVANHSPCKLPEDKQTSNNDLDSCQIEFKNNLFGDLTVLCCMECAAMLWLFLQMNILHAFSEIVV